MTQVAEDAAGARGLRPGTRSRVAAGVLDDLMRFAPDLRAQWLLSLKPRDREQVFVASRHELGTEYGLWQDDPLGFAETVLGETTWSLQRKLYSWSGRFNLVAVPSAFETGKTRAAGALVLWHGSVWPVRTARAVTTATRFRQVYRQLWPEIRMLHSRARLPGKVDQAQWKVPTGDGDLHDVAYGFTAPAHEESAVQGIHAPKLLIVIDEAGGIARPIGDAFVGLVSDEDVTFVAIGNPPTDDENSWFESFTLSDDVAVIRIDAMRTPNYTGEELAACTCALRVPHTPARHMVSHVLVDRTRREHGETSPYYQAKVRARFPKGGASRALPGAWLDAARDVADDGNGRPRVSVDPLGAPYRYQPEPGAWVRLGVDVASDGGDELAIARCEGDVCRLLHYESGPVLDNAVEVSGIVLRFIREAEKLRRALGTQAPVRVKVDAIGVGWGVASTLEAWGTEGLHDAEIVFVDVSEGVEEGRLEDGSTFRPERKRAEMWLAFRSLIQPDEQGATMLALDVDDVTRAQLGAPRMGTRSNGLTYIEKKEDIKKRGLKSPDRAEACLLAVYEPFPLEQRRRRVILSGA